MERQSKIVALETLLRAAGRVELQELRQEILLIIPLLKNDKVSSLVRQPIQTTEIYPMGARLRVSGHQTKPFLVSHD